MKEGERFFYKELALYTPEFLEELGIPSEAPAFISPGIEGTCQCLECREVFSPIIYQAGKSFQAHHFHERSGGIYLFKSILTSHFFGRTDIVSNISGLWTGIMEPFGQMIEDNKFVARAEGVNVKEMITPIVCNGERQQLKSGIVATNAKYPMTLISFRNQKHLDETNGEYTARYEFSKGTDGSFQFYPYQHTKKF